MKQDASIKLFEIEVFHFSKNEVRKRNTNFRKNVLVTTTNRKGFLHERDTTNWSYECYTITEIIDETTPAEHTTNYLGDIIKRWWRI